MKYFRKPVSIIIFLLVIESILVSCGKQDNASLKSEKSESLTTPSGMEDVVKNTSTLDQISNLNPRMMKDPKKDHPKFLELQKKRILLGMKISEIQDPKFKEVQVALSEIYQAKELWTPEIQTIDAKIQENINNIGTGASMNEEGLRLQEQESILLQAMQKSPAFQEYIKTHQDKINALNSDMQKYYTPEIQDMQETIASLNREIYSSTIPDINK